ncbi:hypothetical protein EDD65_102270 [Keratinibaculum paraultunense]|uniref:Uncharacterized protein n=1 Tax=Keratinibaculum paraultunense TaxID=1278232 RepID=A0A4R3L0C4_9FIRM|nr:CD1247 N-terminal domain-containing protein [Keratinibaculum paraultunense]QQY80605.1 hypothetical protein JL105_04710 [Keratinibaculum paraultunense]TCS91335.1 hypothetical protein EDD65_102270 [Keratinibaculum paraultunense]
MEYLYQKVAYLKGLAEGMKINEESSEGKLLMQIIDTLEEFADAMVDVMEKFEDLEEYMFYIDEDLSDVEDEIYGYDYDDNEYDYYPFDEDDLECMEFECDSCEDNELDEFQEEE